MLRLPFILARFLFEHGLMPQEYYSLPIATNVTLKPTAGLIARSWQLLIKPAYRTILSLPPMLGGSDLKGRLGDFDVAFAVIGYDGRC